MHDPAAPSRHPLQRTFAIGLCFATACAACSGPAATPATVDAASPPDLAHGDPLSWDVSARGPYAVGYHLLSATYTPPGGLSPRTIPVHFWYPTDTPVGDHPEYPPLGPDAEAYTDAPPALPPWPAGYPVLVHSHGYKGWPGANAHVARHLASHGWVIIEPQHVGNTFLDTPTTLPLAMYLWRPLDVRAALDLAAALPASDLLAGKLDMKRVAMTGHSFGVYTTIAVTGTRVDPAVIRDTCTRGGYTDCTDAQITALAGDLSEPRARVAMPLAGGKSGEFGANPFNPRGIPVLSMVGTLNQGGEDELYAAETSPDYTYVQVTGGCHELFDLGNTYAGDLGNNSGTPCTNLGDTEGFAIVNPILLAYLRYHILDDRGPQTTGIVTGTASVSKREIYMHK